MLETSFYQLAGFFCGFRLLWSVTALVEANKLCINKSGVYVSVAQLFFNIQNVFSFLIQHCSVKMTVRAHCTMSIGNSFKLGVNVRAESHTRALVSLYSLAFDRCRCIPTCKCFLLLRLDWDGDESPEVCSLLELQTPKKLCIRATLKKEGCSLRRPGDAKFMEWC